MKVSGLFVLFAVCLGSWLSSAQDRNRGAKPTLSISIRSSAASYSIKGKLRLEIQLENSGDEPLLVWRSWGWGVGRTNVRVLDGDGKEVFTSFLADEIPPPPHSADFLELKPKEFFGVQLSEDATHFVNTPGKYEIMVEYTAPLTEEYIRKSVRLPDFPLWGRERGTIVSNKIGVEVLK